jgi:hypothetical protein
MSPISINKINLLIALSLTQFRIAEFSIFDGLEKVVIPVKTGIQKMLNYLKRWIPASAGMTEKDLFSFS